MIRITNLLRDFCIENHVDIDSILTDVDAFLNDVGISSKNIEIDLGVPSNSYAYRYNSESFNVCIDPLAIVNVKNGNEFRDALIYELCHEISHSTVSQGLGILDNVTLEIGWFLKNGFSLDQSLKLTINTSLDNMIIDSILIKNTNLARGFYTRQFIEYSQTKEYLRNNPKKDAEGIWLGEFLGICRRALVSKKIINSPAHTGIYKNIDMNFRSQVSSCLSRFPVLKDAWRLFKTQEETGEDFSYEIHEELLNLCSPHSKLN